MVVPLQAKGREVLAVLWIEASLAFIAIALRWATRKFIKDQVGPDDYILIASWVQSLEIWIILGTC